MKKGDIVLNKYGGVPENRILVYIGNDDFLFLSTDKKIHKGGWNKKATFHDGTPNLEVIGHSNFIEVLKNDIKKYQDIERLKDSDINE